MQRPLIHIPKNTAQNIHFIFQKLPMQLVQRFRGRQKKSQSNFVKCTNISPAYCEVLGLHQIFPTIPSIAMLLPSVSMQLEGSGAKSSKILKKTILTRLNLPLCAESNGKRRSFLLHLASRMFAHGKKNCPNPLPCKVP